MARIVALVPIRHDSERLEGKNYRPLSGIPLYHHIVLSLLSCKEIDEVVIDTDSPLILEEAARKFPDVRLLERPESLCDGRVPMNEVLVHDVSQVDADFYLQTHCTNPLLKAETISRAISAFLESYPRCDSLFGVTRIQKFLWDSVGRPINHNPTMLMRTQDLPAVFEENSNLYLFTAESLLSRRHRLGIRPQMFEIDPIEAWDIDTGLDFEIAEFLLNRRLEGKES